MRAQFEITTQNNRSNLTIDRVRQPRDPGVYIYVLAIVCVCTQAAQAICKSKKQKQESHTDPEVMWAVLGLNAAPAKNPDPRDSLAPTS